jgi:hypothetical protein
LKRNKKKQLIAIKIEKKEKAQESFLRKFEKLLEN